MPSLGGICNVQEGIILEILQVQEAECPPHISVLGVHLQNMEGEQDGFRGVSPTEPMR